MTSDVNPAVFGTGVTYTATVTPENASRASTATGIVQFKVDGVAVGAPVAVSARAGVHDRRPPPPGTAASAPSTSVSSDYTGSTSPTYVQTVRKADPDRQRDERSGGPHHLRRRPTFTATFVNPVAPLG